MLVNGYSTKLIEKVKEVWQHKILGSPTVLLVVVCLGTRLADATGAVRVLVP